MTAPYANPFRTWAELTRGLRDRLLAEVGQDRKLLMSPYTSEILSQLAGLSTYCGHISLSLERLERKEPAAYDAFLRALEKS